MSLDEWLQFYCPSQQTTSQLWLPHKQFHTAAEAPSLQETESRQAQSSNSTSRPRRSPWLSTRQDANGCVPPTLSFSQRSSGVTRRATPAEPQTRSFIGGQAKGAKQDPRPSSPPAGIRPTRITSHQSRETSPRTPEWSTPSGPLSISLSPNPALVAKRDHLRNTAAASAQQIAAHEQRVRSNQVSPRLRFKNGQHHHMTPLAPPRLTEHHTPAAHGRGNGGLWEERVLNEIVNEVLRVEATQMVEELMVNEVMPLRLKSRKRR